MKSILSILAVLCLSFAAFAQEKIPVAPTKIDPKFNADGIPTGKLPAGYEWKRYPGQQWQAYPIVEGVKPTASPFFDSQAQPTATPDHRDVNPGRDALDEVNAARAARGLKPFICDDGLCQAALSAATYRAERGVAGHTQNDFAHLPSGCTASAAGCAAWNVGSGWGSCCTYDSYTYAGAAAVIGRDGRRYMHLFVR